MWTVYILKCAGNSYYTGITTDLKRRISQHQEGCGSKYTASHKPISLVWHEEVSSRSAALKREMQIKACSHSGKVALCRKHRKHKQSPAHTP